MNKKLTPLGLLLIFVGCSASLPLKLPPVSEPPMSWSSFDTSTMPGSNCPKIEGRYSEPAKIYSTKDIARDVANVQTGSYYGHFPFHLADRKEYSQEGVRLENSQFSIIQSSADSFYFALLAQNGSVVEYHFRAEEGDFECKSGYIEFPVTTSYGMIEGKSVNSQVRNVVFRENSGALIIHETIGPYLGDPSSARNQFKHEFLRYPLLKTFPEED